MATSAINASSINIPAGSAIAVKNGKAYPAGPLLATAIATSGAGPNGVITYTTIGDVYLADWSLPSGSSRLTPNKSYAVGSGGRIVAGGSGQPIGIASSIQLLSVTIETQKTTTGTGTGAKGDPGPPGPKGADGSTGTGDIDGGTPTSVYGGTDNVDGGIP